MNSFLSDQDITCIDFAALGLRISARRTALCITQDELAEKAGISVAHLSRIENGRKHISLACVLRLAHALDVSAAYLLTGEQSFDFCDNPDFSGAATSSPARSKTNKTNDQTGEIISSILENCSVKEKQFTTEVIADLVRLLHRYYQD